MDELKRKKILGIWYMIGVGMLLGQIILGGITRLTGSGLSITEWDAILGFLPPFNEQEWTVAFIKYQQFGQYKLLNTSMTLNEFKQIFFWEWFHRLWARTIGVAAIVPLIYFIYIKMVFKEDIIKIGIAILLGAVAGTVGWIMVQSGLNQNSVMVKPVNLMSHILVATLIVMYVLRVGLEYLYPKKISQPATKINLFIIILIVAVFIQIGVGSLVAGSKAALVCTTFPCMNGRYFPAYFGVEETDIQLTLQFIHRNIAYFIFVWVIFIFFVSKKAVWKHPFYRVRWQLVGMVCIQLILGILTLINSTGKIPVVLGVLHQLGAFLLLIFSVEAHYYIKYLNNK